MINRFRYSTVLNRLKNYPVVALLGSRQVGKTTLSLKVQLDKPVQYLDLERPSDLAKLNDPELYLSRFQNHLIILDEIQRYPELFPILRSLVDERKRKGEKAGHFLILGSASPELLRQSSETLAGRISYIELPPLTLEEVINHKPENSEDLLDIHWFRGGYPDSYQAASDADSMQWCYDFITSYVEKYLPSEGVRSSSLELMRFFTMLAHVNGEAINYDSISKGLGIDNKTVKRYIDLLSGLFLVRLLPAWSKNVGKRLIKSPKVYIRDSGILHRLLNIESLEDVLGHPVCGHSWEGYCVEQILSVLPQGTQVSYIRTTSQAEIDLIIEYKNKETWAVEIKRTLSPKTSKGYTENFKTVGATNGFFVIPKGERYPLNSQTDAINIIDFLNLISSRC